MSVKGKQGSNASGFYLCAIVSPCAQMNLIACNSVIIARNKRSGNASHCARGRKRHVCVSVPKECASVIRNRIYEGRALYRYFKSIILYFDSNCHSYLDVRFQAGSRLCHTGKRGPNVLITGNKQNLKKLKSKNLLCELYHVKLITTKYICIGIYIFNHFLSLIHKLSKISLKISGT